MRLDLIRWLFSVRSEIRRPTRARARKHFCLTAEAFENRVLLDGNVSALIDAGSLRLTGDRSSNQVEVAIEAGNVVVRGLNGTTVNGSADDQILVTGATKISGNLVSNLGRGDDSLVVSDGVEVGGDLIVHDRKGASTIGIRGVTIGNDLLIRTGNSADSISIDQSTIGDGIAIRTRRGNDQVVIDTTKTSGSVFVRTYQGADDVVVRDSDVAENVVLRTGRGNDEIVLQKTDIAGNTFVRTWRGADFVVADTVTVGGSSLIKMDGGADTLVTLGTNTFTGSVRASGGGTRRDTVSTSADTTFTGGVRTKKFENTTLDDAVVDDRLNNATSGVLTLADNLQTEIGTLIGDTMDTELTLTTDTSMNQNTIESSDTLVSKDADFVVTGTTSAGATIDVDADGDGQFDDATATADADGNYSVTVGLATGQQTLNVRASNDSGDTMTDEIDVRLAVGTVVRFSTAVGNVDVELLDDPNDPNAPDITVGNFLNYSDRYENSIIHRSIDGFVIQGGGFVFENDDVSAVNTDPPIVNEFNSAHPNLRGTLSMALVGGDFNSGTSQWFFNVADHTDDNDPNTPNLDEDRHTVFGEVIGSGMTVVDSINGLATFNLNSLFPGGNGALQTTPARNYNGITRDLTGNVSVSPGTALVTGTGTMFDSELSVGDRIIIAGVSTTVDSILSDTELTIADNHQAGATDATAQTIVFPTRDQLIVFDSIETIL
ncbi:MAG: peptidylprolyl isomerase [Planctomycetaceae bacterium]|nr:peptidylprolyl isomerase [Planctomycetaceae bacterium]